MEVRCFSIMVPPTVNPSHKIRNQSGLTHRHTCTCNTQHIINPTNFVQGLGPFILHRIFCYAGKRGHRVAAVRDGEEDVLRFNVQVDHPHGVDVL